MDLESNRVYISRSVLFDETTFPAKDKDQDSLSSSSAIPSGNFKQLANTILSSNLLTNISTAVSNTNIPPQNIEGDTLGTLPHELHMSPTQRPSTSTDHPPINSPTVGASTLDILPCNFQQTIQIQH